MSNWTFMGSSGQGNDDFELLETIALREGVIGSDETCELVLRDTMITPRHTRVVHRDGHWYVGGIAAAASTWVNGVPTLPGQAVQLRPGDLVQMGNARFRFGGEPPMREAIDLADEKSLLIWADRQAEAGSPIGERILENRQPDESWFQGALRHAFETGDLRAECRRGVLTSAVFRNVRAAEVASFLQGEHGAGLERLTVLVATIAEISDVEEARGVLQAIALGRPPRLRELSLGWLHGAPEFQGLECDWRAVAKRVPLAGAASGAFHRASVGRFTMLTESEGWPPLGATAVALPDDHWERRDDYQREAQVRGALLGYRTRSGATCVVGEGLVINDHAVTGQSPLVHGDVVRGRGFAFRFEED